MDALTQQDKATAALALVTDRAGVAVGDLARTQDFAANRMKQYRAGVQSLKDNIALLFTKAVQPLISVFGQLGKELSKSTPTFQRWGDKVEAHMKKVAKAWAPIKKAWRAMWDLAKTSFKGIADIIKAFRVDSVGPKGLGGYLGILNEIVKYYTTLAVATSAEPKHLSLIHI